MTRKVAFIMSGAFSKHALLFDNGEKPVPWTDKLCIEWSDTWCGRTTSNISCCVQYTRCKQNGKRCCSFDLYYYNALQ